MHSSRHIFQRALATGLKQESVPATEQALHQRHQFALLQHRLSASEFNQACRSKFKHFLFDLFRRHLSASSKSVFTIAPGAAEIARSKPDEDARHARERRFSLNRTIDFYDLQ